MSTISSVTKIVPPCTITWREVTDPYRGYFRERTETIISRRGFNLETSSGDWLWFPSVRRHDPQFISTDNWQRFLAEKYPDAKGLSFECAPVSMRNEFYEWRKG